MPPQTRSSLRRKATSKGDESEGASEKESSLITTNEGKASEKNLANQRRGVSLITEMAGNSIVVQVPSDRRKSGSGFSLLSLIDCNSEDPLNFPDPPPSKSDDTNSEYVQTLSECLAQPTAIYSAKLIKEGLKRKGVIRLSFSSSRANNIETGDCNASKSKKSDSLNQAIRRSNEAAHSRFKPPRGSDAGKCMAEQDVRNFRPSVQKSSALSKSLDQKNANDENDESVANKSDLKLCRTRRVSLTRRQSGSLSKTKKWESSDLVTETPILSLKNSKPVFSKRTSMAGINTNLLNAVVVESSNSMCAEKAHNFEHSDIEHDVFDTVASIVRDEVEVTLKRPLKIEKGKDDLDAKLIESVRRYCRIPLSERVGSKQGQVIARKVWSLTNYPLQSAWELQKKRVGQEIRLNSNEKKKLISKFEPAFHTMEMRKKAETKEREIATGYFSKRIYGDACGTGNSCYAYYSFKTGESIKPIEYEQKYLKFIKKRKEGRNFLNTSETLNENGHTIRKSQLKMVCEKIDDEDFPYDCRMPKLVMRTENSAISFDEDGDKYENIDIDFDEDGDKYENIEGVYAALNSVDKHQNMKRNGVIKTETTNHTEYHCCQHISTSPCSTSLKLMEKAFVMEPTTISSSVESETPILSTGQSLSDRSNSLTPRSIEAVMRKPVLFHSPNTELAAAEKRLYTEIKGAISRFSEEVRLIRLARHKSEKYTFCDNSDCA